MNKFTSIIIIIVAGVIIGLPLLEGKDKKTMQNTQDQTNFLDVAFDSKEEIVGVATEEIKKHLTNYEEYKIFYISKEEKDGAIIYTVSFDIPQGGKDRTVWVKVKLIDNEWKAAGFFRGRA